MPISPRLLSVIIPVYNEQATIGQVVEKVCTVEIPIEKEIIIVDDGSTDGTAQIIDSVKDRVKEIHTGSKNLGKGAAVRIGIGLSSGDIILIQDADLELDPNEYSKLLEPIISGRSSVVFGSRFMTDNPISISRYAANRFLTWMINRLFDLDLTDMGTAYKVFTREVVGKLQLTGNRFDIDPELACEIARSGTSIIEIPISYRPRDRNEGKKIKWHDAFRAVRMIILCRLRPRSDGTN